MSFSHPVKIEGKRSSGRYTVSFTLGESESTLIFNKINTSWGSFYYDDKEDALHVTVKNQALEKSMEFKVTIEREALQIAAFRNDFRTTRPCYDFIQAANWCTANNVELEQALAWIDRGTYFRVMGEKNYQALSTKARCS